MRWLLLKDLLILRRSRLLVALLVIYPIVIAVLIGFALSRGPDKPAVAFANLVPPSANQISLGGEKIDVSKYADQLFDAIDPVRVDCKGETEDTCEDKVKEVVESGDAVAGILIPSDVTDKLQSLQSLQAVEPPQIKVFYNAEDPVKARYVRDTIKSQIQDANAALTKKFTEVAVGYLDLIVKGGLIDLPLVNDVDILGLESAEQILKQAQATAPPELQDDLARVERFARLARENLDLSDELLGTIGTPLQVDLESIDGGSTPLSSFAIAVAVTFSLMFVTVLLAAGLLAMEREENAFRRLVRGLVSKTGLLVEKAGLAAICSLVVSLLMLCGLGLFVDIDYGRFPFWVLAAGAGGLAFAALGLAIGALTREVRASSLLAFMIALPIAFLALVPEGAVAPALYDVIRVISAIFPFKATLEAMQAALNDTGGIGVHLLHLLALFLGFGALARFGLRRFG